MELAGIECVIVELVDTKEFLWSWLALSESLWSWLTPR